MEMPRPAIEEPAVEPGSMGRGKPSNGADQQPGKPSGNRPLTILILIMAVMTILAGLYSVLDTLVFNFSYIDTNPTLADVREQERTIQLFWPALLVTAILWLWRSVADESHLRIPALALTALALYFVATWIVMEDNGVDMGEPLVMRTWTCPAGLTEWDVQARKQDCVKLPSDTVNWFMIDDEAIQNMPANTYLEASPQDDNISIWEGLPEGRYIFYIANDASVERYERIVLIDPRDDGPARDPDVMHVSSVANKTWILRAENRAWLGPIDVYFVVASEGASRVPRGDAVGHETHANLALQARFRADHALRMVRIAIASEMTSNATSMMG